MSVCSFRPTWQHLGAVVDNVRGVLTDDSEAPARAVTPEALRRDTSDIDFGQRTVGRVLQGMALHDLHHIRKAEAALLAAKTDKEGDRP